MTVFDCVCLLSSNLLWRWEWSGGRSGGSGEPKGSFCFVYVVRFMCLIQMRGMSKYNFNAGEGSILCCLSVCQSVCMCVCVLAPVCLFVSMCVVVDYCVYLFSVFVSICLRFAVMRGTGTRGCHPLQI